MKVSFNKVITKKLKSHIAVWVAKRHLHEWLLAKPYIYIKKKNMSIGVSFYPFKTFL